MGAWSIWRINNYYTTKTVIIVEITCEQNYCYATIFLWFYVNIKLFRWFADLFVSIVLY